VGQALPGPVGQALPGRLAGRRTPAGRRTWGRGARARGMPGCRNGERGRSSRSARPCPRRSRPRGLDAWRRAAAGRRRARRGEAARRWWPSGRAWPVAWSSQALQAPPQPPGAAPQAPSPRLSVAALLPAADPLSAADRDQAAHRAPAARRPAAVGAPAAAGPPRRHPGGRRRRGPRRGVRPRRPGAGTGAPRLAARGAAPATVGPARGPPDRCRRPAPSGLRGGVGCRDRTSCAGSSALLPPAAGPPAHCTVGNRCQPQRLLASAAPSTRHRPGPLPVGGCHLGGEAGLDGGSCRLRPASDDLPAGRQARRRSRREMAPGVRLRVSEDGLHGAAGRPAAIWPCPCLVPIGGGAGSV